MAYTDPLAAIQTDVPVSPHWFQVLILLALVLVANGAPAVFALLRGSRSPPLDGGRVLPDGSPLLGPSKTWSGLAASLALTPLVALALGLDWQMGLAVALGAMAGDLLASFAKRRLGLGSGVSAPVLDQVPESLIPGLLVSGKLGLGLLDLGLVAGAFTALDLALTPVLKSLGRGRRA